MNNTKTTKRALLSSIMAMLICVTMLIGSTFAWFTDSASTAVNKIQAGTLNIALEMKDADGNWVNAEGETLGWKAADGRAQDKILWEPGCTYQLPELRIVNKGNLALKYKMIISGIVGDAKLLDVIDFTYGTGININAEVSLAPNAATAGIIIEGKMRASAGNEYQGLSIDGIGITVVATQDTVEYDSYNNTYDTNATYLNTDAAGNYLIGTADELVYFAKTVNAGESYSGKTVKLTANIDLEGKNWIPVGQTGGYSARTYFQGTFDGQNHTIKNLTIPESTWEAGDDGGQNFATGFFGFIDEGGQTIKNVTFENATVEGHHWVGVAAGYMTGTVSGVKVINSTVTSTYKNGDADGDKAGGVVGYLNSGSSVTGCSVEGSTITAVRDCGSVVGYSAGTVTGNTAKDCTVYYSTDNDEQIGGEIAGKRANGVSGNTATNVTVTKQLLVSTAAELSSALNATYNSDTTIKLANDIDLGGTEWGVHALKGSNNAALVIDGNGKTISGLTSSQYDATNGFNSNGLVTAIMSSLSSVTFKNLTVSGANLTNNGGGIAAAGVFVGDINTVKVTFDTCTVTNATVTSDAYAAGFAGYVQDVYCTDPNLNCPITLKNCTVTNSTFNGGDATGALVGLNNGATTITGATVTGNTIKGGAGYSAAALVGTSVNGTTATGVNASDNNFAITGTNYQVNNTTYGYIYKHSQTYSVNGTELN